MPTQAKDLSWLIQYQILQTIFEIQINTQKKVGSCNNWFWETCAMQIKDVPISSVAADEHFESSPILYHVFRWTAFSPGIESRIR